MAVFFLSKNSQNIVTKIYEPLIGYVILSLLSLLEVMNFCNCQLIIFKICLNCRFYLLLADPHLPGPADKLKYTFNEF